MLCLKLREGLFPALATSTSRDTRQSDGNITELITLRLGLSHCHHQCHLDVNEMIYRYLLLIKEYDINCH